MAQTAPEVPVEILDHDKALHRGLKPQLQEANPILVQNPTVPPPMQSPLEGMPQFASDTPPDVNLPPVEEATSSGGEEPLHLQVKSALGQATGGMFDSKQGLNKTTERATRMGYKIKDDA